MLPVNKVIFKHHLNIICSLRKPYRAIFFYFINNATSLYITVLSFVYSIICCFYMQYLVNHFEYAY